MLWTLILPAWLKTMPLTRHTYHLLSPLEISEPSLSDTVPDTVCTWSLLTPGSASFPLNQDWQRNSSSYCPKNIPHYSATKKKLINPHTKQSTTKSGFKNCSCLAKHSWQQQPTVCTQIQMPYIHYLYTVFHSFNLKCPSSQFAHILKL